MSFRPYTNYEVTIRNGKGKRFKTIRFHNKEKMIDFIDDIVLDHWYNPKFISLNIKDFYKLIIKREDRTVVITIVEVHRDFVDLKDFYNKIS